MPGVCMRMWDVMHLEGRVRGSSRVTGRIMRIHIMCRRHLGGTGAWMGLGQGKLMRLEVIDDRDRIGVTWGEEVVGMVGGKGGGNTFVIFHIVIVVSRGMVRSRELLRGDFVCGEEATSRPSRTAHGMFMTRFVKVWLGRKE